MMRRSSDRLPAENFRSDSQPSGGLELPHRTVSQPLRIDAKDAKSVFIEVVNEVKREFKLSVEDMARAAECPVSSMGDALAAKDSRNFAGHWLIAQGPQFVARHNELMERRLGLTADAEDAIEAEQIGALVEHLVRRGFRARRPA